MPPDLHDTRARIAAGRTTATEALEAALAAAASPAGAPAFVRLDPDAARAAAAAAHAGQPLAGLAVSIKDLFDVAGQVTTAGSRVLADQPPAPRDAPAVGRLRAAGAALIGRTHMVEFAYSGIGTNPHWPTPPAWDALSGRPPRGPDEAAAVPRVPGGSSSGAGVSVATGAAWIGLGSDTGGSLRIPAALNGVVGFKPTARLVPTDGAVPLSTTLDTVGAITRSVRDAVLAHEILAARTVTRCSVPLPGWRLAVVRTTLLEQLDPAVATTFERALARLRAAGARIEEIDLPAIGELAMLQASGGFSAAESYTWHRRLLDARGDAYDPRVARRIRVGASLKAHEYLALHEGRRAWITRIERALAPYDAVLSPTVPLVAPPIAAVAPADGRDPAADAVRDEAFFRANGLMLRNTSVVNMLDGCAISIPCHDPGTWPVGLMLWHGALRDDTVLHLAGLAERILQKT